MKKIKLSLLMLPLFLLGTISSCSNNNEPPVEDNTDNDDNNNPDDTTNPEDQYSDGKFRGIVRVYYHDEKSQESNKNIYVWITGVEGSEYTWDGVEEGYGVYKDIDLCDEKFAKKVTDDFCFIIKKPGTWQNQSRDIKISLSDYLENGEVTELDNGRKRINIYSCSEGANSYYTYYQKKDALGANFTTASIRSDWKTIDVTCSGNCASYSLYALDEDFASQGVSILQARLASYLIYSDTPNTNTFTIDLSTLTYPDGTPLVVKPTITYELIGTFEDDTTRQRTKPVSLTNLYDTQKFIDEYTYDGDDLGFTYTKESTTFKVWAPTSIRADVFVYENGTSESLQYSDQIVGSDLLYKRKKMKYDGNGVYTVTLNGDYNGCYYCYYLYYDGICTLTQDPYAKACGVNGNRSAIVDFSSTNPEGWNNVSYTPISSPSELTAYEVHIRDLTSSSTWISKQNNERGTYNAFHEANTGYNGVSTGFDHIKELGVNAIQILPIFDQDNDERSYVEEDGTIVKPGYNWGYNPYNYNCLEGSYSSNPYDASVRIKEFKELVKDYASNDIRIIMDVVYNHVSSISTHPFSLTVPGYYFRYDSEGSIIDDTGCANTINSSRKMVSKYIVDSVCFWAKEYKIKGFRFDLMGVLETDTMRAVKDALYDIDPEIVVYGEGWTGGGSHATSPSDTYNIYSKLGDNGKGSVGSFNDCYRDGMKGNTTYSNVTPSGGFMDSYSPSDDQIWNSATGVIGQNRNKSQQGLKTPANMSVNYLSCHDNYTLYDQMNYLLNGVSNCAKQNKNAKEASLAATVNSLMSQGIGFINGGEEIFRTKVIKKGDENFDSLVSSYKRVTSDGYSWIEGDGIKINDDTYLVRNSYKYGDSVNGYDWSRKVDNIEYFNKFKEAIALRKKYYGTYLGMSQSDIDSGKTVCLGGNAIGGAFTSNNGSNLIVLTSGRNKGSVNNISSSLQGEYKVVYCSSSRLSIGSSYTVNSTTGIDNVFETLILEKSSN